MSKNSFEISSETNEEAEIMPDTLKHDEEQCKKISSKDRLQKKLYEQKIIESETENCKYPLDNLSLTKEETTRMCLLENIEERKKISMEKLPETQSIVQDIIELESENLERGFILKTFTEDNIKVLINIDKFCKVNSPDVSITFPYLQTPPRHELDDKGSGCAVYDVFFHPEAHELAEKESFFKAWMIKTACDAIENEYRVNLDRTKLKFSNMKFDHTPRLAQQKGIPRPNYNSADRYVVPNFSVQYKNGIELCEMPRDLVTKQNLTQPNELVIEIELPLLNATSGYILDIRDQWVCFKSEQPAMYKINIPVAFPIIEERMSIQFDDINKKLIIRMSVCFDKEKKIRDFLREDSGVEVDAGSADSFNPKHIEMLAKNYSMVQMKPTDEHKSVKFLDDSINYNFPINFDCNTLDDTLAFTLPIKNVDCESIKHCRGDKFVHMKMHSLDSRYNLVHHAFYVEFDSDDHAKISSIDVEPWDNNVILTLELSNYENLKSYMAGLRKDHLKRYAILEEFSSKLKFSNLKETRDIEVSVNHGKKNEVEIQLKSVKEVKQSTKDDYDSNKQMIMKSATSKKQKKQSKKVRSFSESSCDDIKFDNSVDNKLQFSRNLSMDNQTPITGRKSRSMSESCSNEQIKGILKHASRYAPSTSESCSSIDKTSYSRSVDLTGSDYCVQIPEEHSIEKQELSESVKKTVRFNDVIKKQLCRLDSSILSQRKKYQKKRSRKQGANQRRYSEGDSADYGETESPKSPSSMYQKKNRKEAQPSNAFKQCKKSAVIEESSQSFNKNSTKKDEPELSDADGKNSLIFEIDI